MMSGMLNQPTLNQVKDCQFLLSQSPDMISLHLKKGEYWDGFLLQVLTTFLRAMDKPIFIDIGANLGAITVPMGKLVSKKNGRVHSIEAQRAIYYQLCGNIFANNLTKHCFAYNVAVSDMVGKIEIPVLDLATERNVGSLSIDPKIRQQQGTLSTQITEFESVEVTTLDALQLPLASLIKIDVEGLEFEVIKGGVRWIKNSGFPPILFEVWGDYMTQQIEKRKALFSFLTETLGYELFLMGELCIAQHQQNKILTLESNGNSLTMTLMKRGN